MDSPGARVLGRRVLIPSRCGNSGDSAMRRHLYEMYMGKGNSEHKKPSPTLVRVQFTCVNFPATKWEGTSACTRILHWLAVSRSPGAHNRVGSIPTSRNIWS